MKIFSSVLALLFVASSVQAQDIFLQTRLEKATASWLIDKTRVLLVNSEIGDHMTGEVSLTEDTNYELEDITQDTDYLKFRDVFASIFKLDLEHATVRIRIPKIAYQVGELHANPKSMSVKDPTLDLSATALIRGISTTLSQGVDIDLMIPNPVTGKPESYLTAHLDPTEITIPQSLPPVTFDVDFQTLRDQVFTYKVKGYDLSPLPTYVKQNLSQISILDVATKQPISSKNIKVNPITVRLNKLTRSIDFDSFKPVLQKRFNMLLTTVIKSIGTSLQTKIGPRILESVFSSKTTSDLIVKNEGLYTRFVTNEFAQPAKDQLFLGVAGELCTAESYQQYHEQCTTQEPAPEPIRLISDGDRQKAKSEISDSLARGDSDLILSMSEEYVNRLLKTTIQANLWEASLKEQHLGVGPKGAFILFNQRTQTPELFLDVLYYGEGGMQKLVVSQRKPLRFPLRISTSIAFVNTITPQGEVPHLILKTEKVLSDAEEIINGIPEFDMPSKLIFGLKRKIARMVLDMAKDINGKTAVDLELPVLKGIELEKTKYEVSPYGRVNLMFKI